MPIPRLIKFVPVKAFVMTVIILSLLVVKTAIANDIIFKKERLILNGEEYLLEIARSAKQRRQGLMFRDHLDKRHGMLFIYPRTGDHRIWMKNTLIPLTVIWLDKNNIVIGVKKLLPCTSDPCPIYGESKPSKYVLELNSTSHSLEPGIKIDGLSRILD
jgi:uncharacterized membrane protein (UPF0127 family)